MPKFTCEVQTPDGQVTQKVISAASLDAASAQIRSGGDYVLNIREAEGGEGFLDKIRNYRVEMNPGLKDVIAFSRQLAVMIKAGIAVHDATDAIREQVQNQKFEAALKEICNDVEAGQSFSSAIEKHAKIFSPLYVNMMKASEVTGTFSETLEKMVDYLQQQYETRKMVIGASTYPAVLFMASIGAVVFLMTWVLPRFMIVFEGHEDELPGATKALLAISWFFQTQWQFLIAGFVAAVVGLVVSLKTKGGVRFWDKVLLKVPVIKGMTHALYITRSLQALGELVNGGVPILDSLGITADIARNTYYRQMWERVADRVKGGEKLVAELYDTELMPRNVVLMIGAGEEAGRLGEVLEDVSDFYQKELTDKIKTTTALIEPAMILFMGVIVGFIAISIIVPIFKMSQMLAK